jgi:hypothetical protein
MKNKIADWFIYTGLKLSSGDRWVCINSTEPKTIKDIKRKLAEFM